jgi:hypothetical protein
MIRAIAWLVLGVIGGVLGELLFEITDAVSADDDLKPAAVVWFLLLGLMAGVVTCGIAPDRLLVPGAFPGVSLLVTPLVLSVAMAIVGWGRGTARSHLATWYGGIALGLGLAAGRLAGLAFVADVRSI